MLFSCVGVPPRSQKRPRPSSDTSEGSDSGIDGGRNDLDVWALDERHPKFLRDAKEFLLGVPGDDDWRSLLARYVEFEGLAPQVSPQTLPCALHLIEFAGPGKTFNLLAP